MKWEMKNKLTLQELFFPRQTFTICSKWFNVLFGPLISTIVNLKKRPTITMILFKRHSDIKVEITHDKTIFCQCFLHHHQLGREELIRWDCTLGSEWPVQIDYKKFFTCYYIDNYNMVLQEQFFWCTKCLFLYKYQLCF